MVIRTVNTAVVGASGINGAQQTLLKRTMTGGIAPDADYIIAGEFLKEH
jgi:hypothetical protein